MAVIIEVLWVAHGRLPPEMNQRLRVPLRQCYVLILGGGDSPDPFSIPRWNSTQETPRGSDYGLIVEETESRAERRTTQFWAKTQAMPQQRKVPIAWGDSDVIWSQSSWHPVPKTASQSTKIPWRSRANCLCCTFPLFTCTI